MLYLDLGYNNLLSKQVDISDGINTINVAKFLSRNSINLNSYIDNTNADYITAARNYDAVCSIDNTGDFQGNDAVQKAINVGKTNISIRKGTYTLSADIDLLSGVSLYGEDKYDTIIDLNNDYKIKVLGNTPYTTGTITVVNGDATITGSGTSWSASLEVNDYIVFNGNVYKITEVTDNTHLEVEIVYEGKAESGISYRAGTFKNNIYIENLTIQGQDVASTDQALYLYGVVNSSVNNIIIKNNDLAYTQGLSLYYAFNNIIKNITVNNNGVSGIAFTNSDNNSVVNIDANNNGADGGIILTNSDENSFVNIITNNNSIGLNLVSSNNNKFSNLNSANNTTGILISLSSNNKINGSTIEKNDEHGIMIDRSSYNIINGNTVRDNSQKTDDTYSEIFLTDSGGIYSTYNLISSNEIISSLANKAKYGIRENASGDDYNKMVGNTVTGAVTANISTQGTNTIVVEELILTSDQQDALAGTSGTPSSSNKFVTADDVSAAAGSGKIVRASGTNLPALDGSALTGVNGWEAGDDLKVSYDTENINNYASWTKVGSTITNNLYGGTVRVKFTMKTSQGGVSAYGKIYINGSPTGVQHVEASSIYTTYFDDLAVVKDDYIELWCYIGNTSFNHMTKWFRIYALEDFTIP